MRTDQPLVRMSPRFSLNNANSDPPLVIVVDDDASVRESLFELILSAGFQPVTFASPQELLTADTLLDRAGCLILDVRMPGASGLDLQQSLIRYGIARPIIFLTAHGDVPMSVQAMKAGAIDFLVKPVRDQALLDAIVTGIAVDAARRREATSVKENVERLYRLTPRERQVFQRVASGRVNKQIAFELGISEVTVKLHRANVMRKLQATSIGELIRIWDSLPRDSY